MKKIDINSIEINYLDNGQESLKTILFIHGNSHSSRTFRNQFKSQELQNYRLLALDLPGHGNSDELTNYGMEQFSQTIKGFCEALKLEDVILVGHSLGGHIAMEVLQDFNPKGIFIFGAPPLPLPLDLSGFKPNKDLGLLFQNELTDAEITILIQTFYSREDIEPIDVEDLKRTHKEFRALMSQSFAQGLFKDELKLLNEYTGHKAVLCGTFDKLINSDYLKENVDLSSLWRQKIIEVPSSHNVHIENYDLFNQELILFADFVFGINRVEIRHTIELGMSAV